MENTLIDCKVCESLTSEIAEYSTKVCRLCGELHCDECLNEAGYCTPCSEETGYLREDAIPV